MARYRQPVEFGHRVICIPGKRSALTSYLNYNVCFHDIRFLGKARSDAGLFLFGDGKPQTLFLAKDKSKKMGYSSGFLSYIIIPMNRKKADAGKYGIDAAGIEWEEVGCLHANVTIRKASRH